jgi:hypothetical protein
MFLPRYSPEFNPIEMLWSMLKSFLRPLKNQTLIAIEKVVNIFFLLVGRKCFRNFFAKCCLSSKLVPPD